MPCNCNAIGCAEMFDDRVARFEARHFRRKGLTRRARKLLAALERAVPLSGRTTLEVGAGIGGFTITMLERGAANATIIDAAPAYLATARTLASEHHVADRLEFVLGNYAEQPMGSAEVDVVVMDRVVCCYPEWTELLEPAARQARRAIALTWPRDALWVRFGIGFINLVQRLRGMTFRVRVHPTARMRELLHARGLETRLAGKWGPWDIVIAKRA